MDLLVKVEEKSANREELVKWKQVGLGTSLQRKMVTLAKQWPYIIKGAILQRQNHLLCLQ